MFCKIYNCDCLDLMKSMEDDSVDAVVTDPPYDEKTHEGAICGNEEDVVGVSEFGPLQDVGKVVSESVRISLGWCLFFCALEQLGEYQAEAKKLDGDVFVRSGYWDKIMHTPQFTGDRPAQPGEAIAILHRPGKKRWNGGGRPALWRYMRMSGNKVHPTQKPLELIKALIIDFTESDDLVFDPFMGSGTTGVAALQMGRSFIGCEIDKDYFGIAEKRLKDEAGTMFCDTEIEVCEI